MSLDLDNKRKPSNLDLKLPMGLSDNLKSTLSITRKIQKQQRNLIAARNIDVNLDTNSSKDEDDDVNHANIDIDSDSNTDINSDPVSKPDADTSDTNNGNLYLGAANNKRLKRANVPPPLNINLINNLNGNTRAIHSAPIRPSQRVPYPQPLRRRPAQFAHGAAVVYPNGVQVPHNLAAQTPYDYQPAQLLQPVVPQSYAAFPNQVYQPYVPYPSQGSQVHPQVQYVPQQALGRRLRNEALHTSAGQYFARDSRYAHPATTTQGKASVTDVYHGDYTKNAPLESQPLSAQQEAFNRKRLVSDDDAPITDEEIQEMQAKHDRGSSNQPNINLIRHGEIFGSINLMDEAVYNFRIFKQSKHRDEPTEKSTETDDEDVDETGEKEAEKEENQQAENGDAKGETDSIEEDTNDETAADADEDELAWLAKEKAKFLKICETSWDAFIESKRAQ